MAEQRSGINDLLTKRFEAGGTVTELSVMTLDTDGNVVLATGVTAPILGTTLRSAAAVDGGEVDVQMDGICEVIASAAIAEGVPVTAAAAGKVVTSAPAAGVNNYILGFALTAAAADGELIFVHLKQGVWQGA